MRDERPGAPPPDDPPRVPPAVDPAEITSPESLTPDASCEAPDELAADYEILGELGRGGSAVVYHAIDRRLGREVALKVVRAPHGRADGRAAEALARLAREACTVAQLEHPHIVRLHAIHHLRDGLALEMPRVAGQTLKQMLAVVGPLDADHASAILRDVAAALEFAHARGVVHRDVKPENIFVEDYTGRALLADFGVARWQDADAALTQTGVAIGTPAYMSPEQIDGRALDGRADLYSLGLVGWEMLAGRRPWEGESLLTVLQRQQHDELPPIEAVRPPELPRVPLELQYIVERMLQKAPGARWADAGAVGAQLTQPILPMDFTAWRRRHERRVEEARRAPATPRVGALGRLTTALTTLRFSRARLETDADTAAPVTADHAPTWAARPPLRRAARTRIAVASATALTATTIALVVRSTGSGEELPRARATRAARGEVAPAAPHLLETPSRLGVTRAQAPASLEHAFVWSPTVGPRVAALAVVATAGTEKPQARGGTKPQPAATTASAERRSRKTERTDGARGTRGASGTVHVHAPVLVRAPEGAPRADAAPTFVATARDAVWRVAERVRGVAGGEPVPVGAAPEREVVVDSALSRAPRRAELVGAWHHGDRRSRLGDSLTLVLREDGTAREIRRRYSLDPRNSWMLAREQFDGRWEMRYGGLTAVELCITWQTPKELTTCGGAIPDSVDGLRMLTYAGRHWRDRPPAPEKPAKSRASKKRSASRRG
ncbi:serine/threonine-protein kinase [Roseisolibacter agri]|uniref:non-specific serine/threonine protein kinase n=1 Tax=Roseisolibacter agri TaxID=2014610 RepID=A0AA37Q7R3_9BACT|nr:serine/threonine-protein kinase [Roseisolibacter agri]GLC26227.1 hypothetical protein rosag_27400 [Roseisolibacter agri]